MPKLYVTLDRLCNLSNKALRALCREHGISPKRTSKETIEVLIRKFQKQGGIPVDTDDVDAWVYENTPKSKRLEAERAAKRAAEHAAKHATQAAVRRREASSTVTDVGATAGSSRMAASSSAGRYNTRSKGKGKQRATIEDEQEEAEVNVIVQAPSSPGTVLVPATQESSIKSFSQPMKRTAPTPSPTAADFTLTPSNSQLADILAPGVEAAAETAWNKAHLPSRLRATGRSPAPPPSLQSGSLQSLDSLPPNQLALPRSPLHPPGTDLGTEKPQLTRMLELVVSSAAAGRWDGSPETRDRVAAALSECFWRMAARAMGREAVVEALWRGDEGRGRAELQVEVLREHWEWLREQLEAAGPAVSGSMEVGSATCVDHSYVEAQEEEDRMEGPSTRPVQSRKRKRSASYGAEREEEDTSHSLETRNPRKRRREDDTVDGEDRALFPIRPLSSSDWISRTQ